VSYKVLGIQCRDTGRLAAARSAVQKSLDLLKPLVDKYPLESSFAVSLGASCKEMGTVLQYGDEYLAAEEWYARSISTLEAVLTDSDSRNREARWFLIHASMNRAENWVQQRRRAEAIKDWERVIKLSEKSSSVEVQIKRGIALARIGDYVRAIAEVEKLLGQEYRPSALHWYDMACVYSISQAAASQDPKLSPAKRSENAERCASRALELLENSRSAGFFKVSGTITQLIKSDPDMESLRSRPDFQKFVREVEQDANDGSPNNKK
jgi:tetratricopeptide (TPR) repeat protein